MAKNYYHILELKKDPALYDQMAIHEAYLINLVRADPKGHKNKQKAQQNFDNIKDAYAILANPAQRKLHDIELLNKKYAAYLTEHFFDLSASQMNAILHKIKPEYLDGLIMSDTNSNFIAEASKKLLHPEILAYIIPKISSAHRHEWLIQACSRGNEAAVDVLLAHHDHLTLNQKANGKLPVELVPEANLAIRIKMIQAMIEHEDFWKLDLKTMKSVFHGLTQKQINQITDSHGKSILEYAEKKHNIFFAQLKLNKHLESQIILPETEFTRVGNKETGVASGYIGARDEQRNMVKPAVRGGFHNQDKIDLLREFVSAPLHKRNLHGQAPEIELISEVDAHGKAIKMAGGEIAIRSKFHDKFQSLVAYTGGNDQYTALGSNLNKLAVVTGVEKVIAGCYALGDPDFHGNNLGVNTDTKELKKIDHGRSLISFFSSESKMRINLAEYMRDFGYGTSMRINASKLRESVQQMGLNNAQFDDLVAHRCHQLQAAGFNPDGLDCSYWMDNVYTYKSLLCPYGEKDLFKEFKAVVRNNLAIQQRTMQEFAVTLEVIENIVHPNIEWQNGKWLEDIKDQDPLSYAYHHQLKLKHEGKEIDAITYAIYHNKKIENMDPLPWFENQTRWSGGLPTGDVLIAALENNMKIRGQDPLEYAIEHYIPIKDKDGASMSACLWAVKNGYEINGLHPIIYAIKNNKTAGILGLIDQDVDILTPIFENYCNLKLHNSKANKVLLTQLEEFYDNALLRLPNNSPENLLGKDSVLAKQIIDNPYSLAREIDDLPTQAARQVDEPVPDLTKPLLQNCKLGLLFEITKFSQNIVEREHNKDSKLQSFRDFLNKVVIKFRDLGAVMFGQKNNLEQMQEAVTQMNSLKVKKVTLQAIEMKPVVKVENLEVSSGKTVVNPLQAARKVAQKMNRHTM